MPHRPAVAFSRHLGFAGAVALGGGVALAVVAVVGPVLVEIAGVRGSGAHLLAALLFLPLVLSRLDVPGSDGDAYLSTRGTTVPGLAFAVGWTLLGGYLALSALLTDALVGRLAEIGGSLFGLETRGWVLTLTVLGLVAINELLGTRGRERPLLGVVAVAALLLAGDFAWALWRWRGDTATDTEVATLLAGSEAAHRLLPLALLAATLWGPELVLERRRVLQNVARNAPRALVVAWIAAHAVGALGLLVVLERPRLLRLSDDGSWIDHRPELVLAVAVALLCLLGLSQSLAGAVRLAQELAGDGLLPSFVVRHRSERGVPYVPLVAAVALIAPWVSGASTIDLVAASALAILVASALALWPHARRGRRDLAERSFGLPLHPVLPMVAIGSALFLALLLDPAFSPFALWSAVGALLFVLVGRRGAAEVAKRERFVSESDDVDPEVGKVLVAVGGGPSTESLVRVAAALARARGHELVVLRVAVLVEQTPLEDQRREAEGVRRALAERVRATLGPPDEDDPAVHVAVRIAPTIAAGILETTAEMGADFLVVGWGGEEGEPSASVEPVVEAVFPATSKAMAVVHGPLPEKIRRVLVGSAGGPHAAVAVELARALGHEAEETAILNVVTPGRRDEEKPIAAGEEALRQTREKAGGEEDAFAAIGERVVQAGTIEEGIEREAGARDVLLLGASIDRLLDQTVLGGFPLRVAGARRGATLVVKRAEGRTRFWRRRVFEGISGLLPTLDDTERVTLMANMRRSSRADVDFYLLIALSAAIAALGLMQSSPAVVIGAMLVAPLMSPILAMGHAVVLGYPRLLRRAASSTLKGVGLAVTVGALSALIFPSIRPTPEILARGAPSLLDLLVALASGAAAAYAVSRRSVAAALPGVAIAAALVPPLCVVGYGLGASELALSGGALLLFTTNLAGIVLSGATVFVLLGVRPARPGTGRQVWRGLLTTGLLLGVIAIPLVSETRDVLERSRLETRIVERLGDDRLAEAFTVRDLEIERTPSGGVVVHATILEHGRAGESDLDLGPLEDARRRLEAELDVPIRLRATVFRGTFVEMGQ